MLWQRYQFRRPLCRVPEIETGIVRLTILGSEWGWQGQVHWGLPERWRNCFIQGIDFQKCGSKDFGKTKIKLDVGKIGSNENKAQATLVTSVKEL
jgi:hypothetical protein